MTNYITLYYIEGSTAVHFFEDYKSRNYIEAREHFYSNCDGIYLISIASPF